MTQRPTPSIDRIEVSVGFDTHPEGAAHLSVSEDGSVSVTTSHLQERKAFDGKIEADAATRLMQEASGARPESAMGKRAGIPDEARYTLKLSRGGEEVVSIEAWESELEGNPPTKKLLDELRNLTSRVSDGQAVL